MSSRQEDILAYLKSEGPATLAELATALGLTKQGALRHIASLEASALVITSSRKAARGRPAHVYALAAAADERFPQGHRELARELVDFIPQDELKRFFKRRARAMQAEYGGRMRGLDLEGRVRELAQLASEHGHMADVVPAGEGAYAIRQHNCPIADVAGLTGHPCQAEQELYRRLLGVNVKRDSWIPEGSPSCTYLIKEKG
ncbi:MAG TPA: HTH domain-containing protein [Candidatus Dormibacteraeota bacterium]